jgi:hypothetical protein
VDFGWVSDVHYYHIITMVSARKRTGNKITGQVPKKVQFSEDEQVSLIVDIFTQEDSRFQGTDSSLP